MNNGIARELQQKIVNMQRALDKDRVGTMCNKLDELSNEVQKKTCPPPPPVIPPCPSNDQKLDSQFGSQIQTLIKDVGIASMCGTADATTQ